MGFGISRNIQDGENLHPFHQRWDDKISPYIVELFVKNAHLFDDDYDPDRVERKILRYIQMYREDIDLYDFDDWNDSLEQLAKDDLSASQMTIVHNIAKEVDKYLTGGGVSIEAERNTKEEAFRKTKEAEVAKLNSEEKRFREEAEVLKQKEEVTWERKKAEEERIRKAKEEAKEREKRNQEEEKKEKRENIFMVLGIVTGVLALIWFCVVTWQALNSWAAILIGVLFGIGVFIGASGLLVGDRDTKIWNVCLFVFIIVTVILFVSTFSLFLSLFAGLFCSGLLALVSSLFSLFEE